MNPASLSVGVEREVSLQPEWQQQLETWRELIAQCARKPSRRRVHALRRLTLRLQAAIEHGLREQGRDSALALAFKKWKKEGKELRRALGPVRDADVFMARLKGLRKSPGAAVGVNLELNGRAAREIDKLEARLKAERRAGAEQLISVLAAHSKRRDRRSLAMEEALAPGLPLNKRSAANAALKAFAELTREFPALDAENLHAYRKRLKQALYLAELSAPADPLATRLAAAFRKIHLAAGEWHDWQTLASRAARTFPSDGKPGGLAVVLDELAQWALKRAIGICRHTAVRFLTSTGAVRPLEK